MFDQRCDVVVTHHAVEQYIARVPIAKKDLSESSVRQTILDMWVAGEEKFVPGYVRAKNFLKLREPDKTIIRQVIGWELYGVPTDDGKIVIVTVYKVSKKDERRRAARNNVKRKKQRGKSRASRRKKIIY